MAKIMVNVQKRLNGASAEADFWYGDNLDHVEKKDQNSEFHWGPLHGENGNIVLQISVHKLLVSKIGFI